MKYLVFAIAATGVLPLAFLLYLNRGWMKYVIWGMMAVLCVYQSTAINFFSHEEYHGSARGMEVSLAYLLSASVLLSIIAQRRFAGWLPEKGYLIYLIYFLLCLPSLTVADNCLISWFEIWKMIMLFLVYLAVYSYLRVTGDLKTILWAFLFFAFVNCVTVLVMHFHGIYQPRGIFPHRNCMAMAMLLLGSLFFANYLMNGSRTWFNRSCMIAFVLATISTLWSYSRGAFAVMPIAYGLTALACLFGKMHLYRKIKRLMPLAVIGIMGIAVMIPRIIERFVGAPEASKNTRVELACCAREMIKDKPWQGVGINNWSLKMQYPYPYQEQAGEQLGVELNYTGIVETVYLLVCAECGIPALLAMLAWFGWYWISCIRLMRHLWGTHWFYIPAGLLGGLTANYLQSTLEWVLRQQINLICLVFMFAILAYLNTNWRELRKLEAGRHP